MLTAAMVAPLFPGANPADVRENLALVLSALRKEGLGDPEMTAMAIASVRVEAAGFAPVREGRSRFNTVAAPFDVYEPASKHGRKAKDLGNTRKGDGFKYRGNGLPQLTGRANHATVGKRLGLPLEDRPELVMEPEISARVLASFLKRDERAIRAALRKGDLKTARRLYNGGSHGLEVFKRTYKAVLAMLPGAAQLPLPPKPPAEKLPPAVSDLPKREATATDVAKRPGAAAVAAGAGAGGIEQAQAKLADAHGWLAGVADYLDWLRYPLIVLAVGLAGLAVWRIVRRR